MNIVSLIYKIIILYIFLTRKISSKLTKFNVLNSFTSLVIFKNNLKLR